MSGIFESIINKETENFNALLRDMVGGVNNVSEDGVRPYLERKFGEYLPEKSKDELNHSIDTIMSTIRQNNENLRDLDAAKERGVNRDAWFAEKTKSVLENESREAAVKFYEDCSESLQQVNEFIYDTLTGKDTSSQKDMVIDIEAYEVHDDNQPSGQNWDEKSWNEYKLSELAMGVGKQAANNAVLKAAASVGSEIVESIVTGESVDVGEVVERAVTSGLDTGAKAAVAGSLYIASEKGMLRILPKGTPVKVLTNIAYTAVENIKIAFKVATGKMTVSEGLSRAGDVAVSVLAGMATDALKTGVKVAATAVFGPVGAAVSTVVTSSLSKMAGGKIATAVSEGVKKVATGAVNIVKTAGRAIVDTGRKVVEKVKSVGQRIANFFGF
ncbi:hypothetical protein [Ruminococcus sp. HUN007]|uniref:hypothetical protein n=1 Tax=Ruminococcus sp. HUN007 TaxID=1514668 RepID=UPI0005D2C1E2|nr:hypothetical protein [Ruminococcus sp. HUN007]